MKRFWFLLFVVLLTAVAFSETEAATENTLEDLISKKTALIQELNNLELQISYLLSGTASVSLKAQEQLNELRSQIDALVDELDYVEEMIDNLKSVQNDLGSNLVKLQSQLKDLELRLTKIEQDISNLKTLLSDYEEKSAKMEEKVFGLEEQLAQLSKKANLNFMIAVGGVVIAVVAVLLGFFMP